MTEDHKRKIGLANSIALRGRKRTEAEKEAVRKGLKAAYDNGTRFKYWKGKHFSEEHRLKILRFGDKAPNWRGGKMSESKKIRNSLKYKLWREEILRRDVWGCQMPGCRTVDELLEVNHIKRFVDFPELRFDISNGITLCNPCHNQTKFKESKFENLFMEIIKSKA